MRDEDADRHARERERKRRKARHGMRVSGRSVRMLARLGGVRRRRRKGRS